ncbi:hypothetical protein RB628_29410 [Streptomyces sp. ADMS]|uniref:hypothetical protein n=1 Tax=Streptomyces sp. ADMS TaxID=3071415 RepID=UPI00296F2217|nr:hypothetical protein [Streptomyces sp. ADMS]MDW4909349.1 hypothetical protein [Streptomyces sp. ADMS]
MERSFKLHGGIAAGLSTVLLLLAALTWLPGTLPLAASKWPMVAIVVLLFPIFIAALVRVFLSGADRYSMWLAFRCLPGRVQAALGALAVSGVLLMLLSEAGAGNWQAPEAKDGRYFVLDTTPHARGTIEVSHSQYEAVLESDQRSMLAIPGILFAGAAYVVLAAGELRRADVGFRSS